ncbi:unnamed protein product [Heterobilharzia americana]|nr:unnamed protein product [Heterobilharzia americana]
MITVAKPLIFAENMQRYCFTTGLYFFDNILLIYVLKNIESNQESATVESNQFEINNPSLTISSSSCKIENIEYDKIDENCSVQSNVEEEESLFSNISQLSSGIYSALKETIDKVDLAFCDLQFSQKQLQDQLIGLDQAIGRLANAEESPLNLEPLTVVLQEYKQRVLKVHNSLRHSQDRVNRLRHNLQAKKLHS